ncbi:hypothetical protein [Archaeoglobus profundus]|uniref:Uncharacterized protein n=1 Tax=Archaeoglobus profundus (strain DSM 5631 / JCM 9629 / NBRC 100127 / Av18) TaxID=572546 RepID=D2RGP7_ARCPA|nr:hypothetical protein [Archaeoglobus profundus]ADB57472.1 hypothetical protein Arcpr_0404 [Archaeoglobus profundus DSM 5631]
MNLQEAVIMALKDVEALIPKMIVSVILICLFFVLGYAINRALSKIFEVFKVGELFKPLARHINISFSSLMLAILNVGIALTALYTISSVAFPEGMDYLNMALEYFGRVLSVIFLIAIVFVAVSRISEKIAVEGKMRGFMTLMTLFIVLVLLIDVTNLTPEIKSALAWGLSIGIGISMGVFSAWFFFHDILSKKG